MKLQSLVIPVLSLTVCPSSAFVVSPSLSHRSHSSPLPFLKGSRISSTSPRQYAAVTNKSISLSSTSSKHDETCDVLVLGSGPAARAIATLLSSTSSSPSVAPALDVILADANLDLPWAPNYGVWKDEWEAIVELYSSEFGRTLEFDKVVNREWSVTDCYFGGSFDVPTESRLRVDRPYLRIDRDGLRAALTPDGDVSTNETTTGGDASRGTYRQLRANHASKATSPNIYSPSGSLVHDETGSTILLQPKVDKESDGTEAEAKAKPVSVRAKLIVDCTGHETKLVLKDGRSTTPPAGFQIAYGILVSVDESNSSNLDNIGPYSKEAMTLFDYRTDHYEASPHDTKRISVEAAPTFMYAMPLESNKIFFEETSLVARPAVSFQECKDRCLRRLEHLDIRVTDVEEEEFCYIPMGGPLPAKDQRVVAFGGAAAVVHPSTGYNLCRNLVSAADVARCIRTGLATTTNDMDNAASLDSMSPNLDAVAASAYHAIWSPSNIRQRNFAVFGGEFLQKQNVVGLRGFFGGFFRLSIPMWGGFLAGWPGLPNNDKHESWVARLWFGLNFISKLPLPVAVDMLVSILGYTLKEGMPYTLLQSVTPLLGEPEGYEYVPRPRNQGDVAAKNEARRMIAESKLEMEEYVALFDKDRYGVVGPEGEDEDASQSVNAVDPKVEQVETVTMVKDESTDMKKENDDTADDESESSPIASQDQTTIPTNV